MDTLHMLSTQPPLSGIFSCFRWASRGGGLALSSPQRCAQSTTYQDLLFRSRQFTVALLILGSIYDLIMGDI